jgi:hypothetical protein
MKPFYEIVPALSVLEKIIINDIENLRKFNASNEILLLIQNHLFHLQVILSSQMLKDLMRYCDAETQNVS